MSKRIWVLAILTFFLSLFFTGSAQACSFCRSKGGAGAAGSASADTGAATSTMGGAAGGGYMKIQKAAKTVTALSEDFFKAAPPAASAPQAPPRRPIAEADRGGSNLAVNPQEIYGGSGGGTGD